MRDAHCLDRGSDRSRVHQRHVLADTAERDVRTQRFSVKRDVTTRELGTNALPKSENGWRASADTEPNDARLATGWESAGMVDLDVERGHTARGRLDRAGHVSQALVGSRSEEGERHVHQLRFHATERGKIRRAAEHRFRDLGGEWERDEEPYPRRLEPRGSQPCGLYFVRHKLRDEHHREKTAEACERGHAKTLALRDAFPRVGDQGSHCGTLLSKQRAAWC